MYIPAYVLSKAWLNKTVETNKLIRWNDTAMEPYPPFVCLANIMNKQVAEVFKIIFYDSFII